MKDKAKITALRCPLCWEDIIEYGPEDGPHVTDNLKAHLNQVHHKKCTPTMRRLALVAAQTDLQEGGL